MKKIMMLFGTRPEAIKMCPLVKTLQKKEDIELFVAVSGQHREMLYSVLREFEVRADIDLEVMREGAGLPEMTSSVLCKSERLLREVSPDLLLVHGDTTTAFAAALAAFYCGIPVGHVEAGLRSGRIYEPYPEEFNRRAISCIAELHFAPTECAKKNLLREGIDEERIYVTGNTVIDALKGSLRADYTHPELEGLNGDKLIILTVHRRESIGEPMKNIFRAVRRVAEERNDIKIIYPVHPNPLVREIAGSELGSCERIRMIEPLEMMDFHNFMARSYMILTDSGGIQEEGSALGVPVLVLRNRSERTEGISCGGLKLVGTDEEEIYRSFCELLSSEEKHREMAKSVSVYGDGNASKMIADIISKKI